MLDHRKRRNRHPMRLAILLLAFAGISGIALTMPWQPASTTSEGISGASFESGAPLPSSISAVYPSLKGYRSQKADEITLARIERSTSNGRDDHVLSLATDSSNPETLYAPTLTSTFTVTNTNDGGAGSLRQAISNAASGDTINFSLPVGSTITLTSGELVIEKNLTINGPGPNQLTVSGNNLTRVFNIVGNFNVTLSGLTIANGKADDFGGGILNDRGTVNVTNSTLSGNSAAISGGGIATTGTMNVTGSTLSGNSATFFGGGIHHLLGTVNVTNSTLSGNSGASFGGGIKSDAGTVNVTNSTLSGNSATSFGGGISNSGALNVINSTLSGNSAPTSGGIGNLGTVISKSTIIAGNTAGPFGADLSGFFASQGYNLIGNADGSIGFENGVNNDQVGTAAAPLDPLLGPLANNGGLTQTRVLLAGSPAIDKGGPAAGVTTDQRGFTRPVDDPTLPNAAGGDGSDIGAFEVQPTPLPPATTIQFTAAAHSETESGGSLSVNVTRSGDIANIATVEYKTSDTAMNNCNVINGIASSRCDYISSIGTLRFVPGESSKSILILIVDDAYAEGHETFTISLSNPTGASLGTPNAATVTISDNDTVTGSNPIDLASFFAREHYMDFLNREPDASGLAFWTNEITQCGSNQACTEIKRINVSAAFFLSIEFQETGYLVYRMYKVAYGDTTSPNVAIPVPIIRLNEFLPDAQRIGQGVRVGIGDWQAQLENNKNAYALEFVQRQRFLAAYPLTMTPTQFVDKLDLNAGGVLSQAERDQLIVELTAATDLTQGRASVTRKVAEDADLRQRETNRAFVLMQYYGYLRRNPDDPQDTDFRGWAFWLNKLTQFNGNFVEAEMVKAFILSIEYRQRFGP